MIGRIEGTRNDIGHPRIFAGELAGWLAGWLATAHCTALWSLCTPLYVCLHTVPTLQAASHAMMQHTSHVPHVRIAHSCMCYLWHCHAYPVPYMYAMHACTTYVTH